MPKVYRNAQEDKNEYAADGWDVMPFEITGGNFVAFKDIRIPYGDDMVKGLLSQYNSEEWQKNALGTPRIRKYMSDIGFRFRRIWVNDGERKANRLVESSQTKERLCTWRVEMDFSDGYLRLSPFDVTFPYSFYGMELLDRYAPEIVESAKSKGLIEEAELDA